MIPNRPPTREGNDDASFKPVIYNHSALAMNQSRIKTYHHRHRKLRHELKHGKPRVPQGFTFDDDEDDLVYQTKQGFSKFMSIKILNFSGFFLLLAITIGVLSFFSISTTLSASSSYAGITERNTKECTDTSERVSKEMFVAVQSSSDALGNLLLTSILGRLGANVGAYLDSIMQAQRSTEQLIADFQIDISKWDDFTGCPEPPCKNWKKQPGLGFLVRYLFSAMKSEDGVEAFEVRDGINDQAVLYLGEAYGSFGEIAYIQQVPARPEQKISLYSTLMKSNGEIDKGATCKQGKADIDTCDKTAVRSKDLATYQRAQQAPLGDDGSSPLLWSQVWAYQASMSVNLTFPLYQQSPTGQNVMVGIVSRVVGLRTLASLLGNLLSGFNLQGVDKEAEGITDPKLYIMDVTTGKLIAVSEGLYFQTLPKKTAKGEPYAITRNVSVLSDGVKINPVIRASAMALLDAAGEQYRGVVQDLRNNGTWETHQEISFEDSFQGDASKGNKFNFTHESGTNETFHVLGRRIKLTGKSIGLSWGVVMVMSEKELNLEVVRTQNSAKTTQAQQAQLITLEVDEKLKATSARTTAFVLLMLGIAIALFILGLVVSVIFNHTITQPLQYLIEAMRNVAYMELDSAPGLPRSRLKEITTLQTCFLRMVKNLKTLKAFMPDMLFDGQDGDDDDDFASDEDEEEEQEEEAADEGEDADADGEPKERDDDSASQHSETKKKRRRRHKNDDESSHSSWSTDSGDGGGRKRKGRRKVQLGVSLTQRKITCMVIDIEGFNDLPLGAKDLVSLHSDYINHMMKNIKENKGVLDRFTGDRIFASWNTLVIQGSHQELAVKAALQCKESMIVLNRNYLESGFPEIKIRIAIASGNAQSGNIGCDSLKGFAVLGPVVNLVYALDKLAKDIGTPILVDDQVFGRGCFKMVCRPVDAVCVQELAAAGQVKEKMNVYEVMKEQKQGEVDEWMYELEEAGNQKDEYKDFKEAYKKFLAGKLEEALDLVDKQLANGKADSTSEKLRERIKKEIDEPTWTKDGGTYLHRIGWTPFFKEE